jgi:hypothetical protein
MGGPPPRAVFHGLPYSCTVKPVSLMTRASDATEAETTEALADSGHRVRVDVSGGRGHHPAFRSRDTRRSASQNWHC